MRSFRRILSARPVTQPAPELPGAAKNSVAVTSVVAGAASPAIAESGKYFAAQRYTEALALIEDALATTPASQVLLFASGSVLFAWGRFHEALDRYRQAEEAGLVNSDLDLQLGWTCFRLHRLEEAEAHFRRAVARAPDSGPAWIALANLLETRGTLAQEAGEFVPILSQWPENYRALMLLAACRFHLGDKEGGTDTFWQATRLDPAQSQAWSNLGVTLGQDRRYAEGLEVLQRAFDIDAANGEYGSVFNYATALREDGRWEEAMRAIEMNLARNPDPRILWLRSMFLLENGQLIEGMIEHEFRWMREPLVSMRWSLRRPIWAGQDLRGKTILLHAEQGLGDAIQFIRYARLLKERGARVLFDAFRGFQEIAADFDDVDEVMRDGPMPSFDYHIPLLSLPRVFRTTQSSIPAHAPYVKVRPDHQERLTRLIRPTDKLKVGLVWAGNPKHLRDKMRSLPIAKLSCLKRVEGVQFYSLQKGSTAAADIASTDLPMIDLGQHFETFCDTAAAISLLDLVISVDTSVAHLAGALAKPVWLMVANPADWRWFLRGERTPWYPTMRIFRQRDRDRWDPVIESIEKALRGAVEAGDVTAFPSVAAVPPVPDTQLTSLNLDARSEASKTSEAKEEAHWWRVDETRYGIIQYPSRPAAIADSLRYYGEYVHPQLQTMARFVRPGSWVLEADAGFGMVTLFLAEAVGSDGHVVAYETDPLLSQVARQNLSANRVRNVTFLTRALDGRAPIETQGNCSAPDPIPGIDTIDGLRLRKLDWIRINDASRARAILSGAESTLWSLRPWLFICGNGATELREAETATRDYGYGSREFVTPLFNPENYNRRPDDIFAGRKAWALLLIPEEVDIDINLESAAVAIS
jgi:tetratricopeptide (TPR) repeat protein